MTIGRRSPFRSRAWLQALGLYLTFALLANGLWETLHVRLYTVWHEANPGYVAFAVAHCTVGDVLIGLSALTLALMFTAPRAWPLEGSGRVAALTTGTGLIYTVFSEWVNTGVRGSWTYTESMPVVPFIGTGLTPLLQWLVIPPLGLWLVRRMMQASSTRLEAIR